MKSNLAVVNPGLQDSDTNYKDGDGNDLGLVDILVSVALNGYQVTFIYDDGSEERYIHADFDEVVKAMKGRV